MKYIEHILEFELFEIGKFSLSVYNLLLIVIIFFAVKGINHSLDLLVKKRFEKKGFTNEGRGKSINQIFKYMSSYNFIFILTSNSGYINCFGNSCSYTYYSLGDVYSRLKYKPYYNVWFNYDSGYDCR